jgi:hypothetical protein
MEMQSGAARCARLVAVACVLAVLGGCGSFGLYKGYAAAPIDITGKETAYDRLDKAIRDRTSAAKECFADQYKPGSTTADCAGLRNQVISYLMAESVALCVVHVSEIYGKEAGFNIATGSIASLTSGFAAISPGSRAATLSAISSFTSAERALVNESVYKNLLTTAIATKIEQSRATLGKTLINRKKEPYKDYRIEDAIYDVIDYHHACSFYKGMELALAEGTNTNPATKLALLETQAQALAQQIDVRAQALGMDANARKTLLSGNNASGDPVLKGLIARYDAIQQQILTGIKPANPPKKDAAGSGGGSLSEVPGLDFGADDVVNPLATLVSAEAAVKKSAAGVVEAVKEQAKADGKKELPDAYLKAVAQAGTNFASQFRTGLLATVHPTNGAIARALKTFHDAQRDYLVKVVALTDSLQHKQDKVDLVAVVSKAGLALQDLQQKVAKCQAAATRKLDDFAKAEVDGIKKLDDANAQKLAKIISASAPAWAAADGTACLN